MGGTLGRGVVGSPREADSVCAASAQAQGCPLCVPKWLHVWAADFAARFLFWDLSLALAQRRLVKPKATGCRMIQLLVNGVSLMGPLLSFHKKDANQVELI